MYVQTVLPGPVVTRTVMNVDVPANAASPNPTPGTKPLEKMVTPS